MTNPMIPGGVEHELGFINIPADIIQAAKDMLASYQNIKHKQR